MSMKRLGYHLAAALLLLAGGWSLYGAYLALGVGVEAIRHLGGR